ncbi:hypothetical protein EB796_012593 [Bugula neritina]|uniref:Uncharacterized protein n=1 Tax=Bugula neritina TaxID=10212 RepID=A0A7J7JRW7_BUGNE|nr:hypothetical protein EB796_012593 [Bugula neritina]
MSGMLDCRCRTDLLWQLPSKALLIPISRACGFACQRFTNQLSDHRSHDIHLASKSTFSLINPSKSVQQTRMYCHNTVATLG